MVTTARGKRLPPLCAAIAIPGSARSETTFEFPRTATAAVAVQVFICRSVDVLVGPSPTQILCFPFLLASLQGPTPFVLGDTL